MVRPRRLRLVAGGQESEVVWLAEEPLLEGLFVFNIQGLERKHFWFLRFAVGCRLGWFKGVVFHECGLGD